MRPRIQTYEESLLYNLWTDILRPKQNGRNGRLQMHVAKRKLLYFA